MLQEGKSRKNENTGNSQISEKQYCSPSHASWPFINYLDTIVVKVTDPGRKTGFIRCSSSQSNRIKRHNYTHGVKKYVINTQALMQEFIETKAIMCSQNKLDQRKGLWQLVLKSVFHPKINKDSASKPSVCRTHKLSTCKWLKMVNYYKLARFCNTSLHKRKL